MAIFSDVSKAPSVGPVRSLRHTFVMAIMQWDPIIQDFGASDYAVPLLRERGIYTINVEFDHETVYSDEELQKTMGVEHTWFTNTALLDAKAESAGIRYVWQPASETAFSFAKENEPPLATAQTVRFSFSAEDSASVKAGTDVKPYADGEFRYDPETGRYFKYQWGEPVIDDNYGEQVAFDSVFIIFGKFGTVSDRYLLDADFSQGGEGVYLSGGRSESITWDKDDWDADFVFTRVDGSPLEVNTGTTYIAATRNEDRPSLVIENAAES